MESRLAIAQSTIEAAFDEIEDALVFARGISEKRNPNFWKNASRITLQQRPLVVFAIRYPINSDLPIYEISWNPIFEPETGIAFSEDWIEEEVKVENLPENNESIDIKRLGSHQYEQVAS